MATKTYRTQAQSKANAAARNKAYADKLKEKRAAVREQKAQEKAEFTDKWLSEVEDVSISLIT